MAEAVVLPEGEAVTHDDDREIGVAVVDIALSAIHSTGPSVARAPPSHIEQHHSNQRSENRNGFSLLGAKRIVSKRHGGYEPLQNLSHTSSFRSVVDQASTKTKEVDALKTDTTIISDDLDGTYEIQYEQQNGHVVERTINLGFKRGFCGWNIRGKRSSTDHGLFVIQQGFLAQSGQIYWEERGETYNVLVAGHVDVESGAFDGDWLSSNDMQTGRFTKLVRCRDDDQKEAESSGKSTCIV